MPFSKKLNKNISYYSVKDIRFLGGTIFYTTDMSPIYLPPFWYAPHVSLCKLCTQIKSSIPIVLTMNGASLQWILDSHRQKKVYKIKSYAHRSNKWQRRQCLISAGSNYRQVLHYLWNRGIHNLSLLMIATRLSNLRYDVLPNRTWFTQYEKFNMPQWYNF